MSIIAQGIDLVECSRVADILNRHEDRFLKRVLTPREIVYVRGRRQFVQHVAGRFAAKEAILKVLGTGWRTMISWKDMEILNDRLGKPELALSGECAAVARRAGIDRVLVSISHTDAYAMGSAIAVSDK